MKRAWTPVANSNAIIILSLIVIFIWHIRSSATRVSRSNKKCKHMSVNMIFMMICVFCVCVFFCRYYYSGFCIVESRSIHSTVVIILGLVFFVALIFCDAFLFSASLTHCVVSRSTSVIIITSALYFLCHAVNHLHWILFFHPFSSSIHARSSHFSLRNCNSFCRWPTNSHNMPTTICLVVGIYSSFFSVKKLCWN